MEDVKDSFAGNFLQIGYIVVGIFYFGNNLDVPNVIVNVVNSQTNKIIEDDIVQIIF